MKQGLDLNVMGLVPMDQLEMQNLEGGNSIIRRIFRAIGAYIAEEAVEKGLPEYNKTLTNLGPSAMNAAMMFN